MRLKKLFLAIVLMTAFIGSAQLQMSNNCRADLKSIAAHVEKNKGKVQIEWRKVYPIHSINNRDYVNLLAKKSANYSSKKLTDLNAIIGGESGDVLSLKWPVDQLADLWDVEGLAFIQVAQKVQPTLSRVRYDTRVDSVHAGIGLNSAYTGKNVLIGITDWGFDYSSPMFYDTLLQNTRILSAWDQFKTNGPSPNGFNYGTEYNLPAELIAAGTDTANIYSYGTHGTHVAGIAGGSGAGTEYRGIAFESQYLMATFLIDEGAVLDAWQWMFDKAQAENKRLVVNMSWGLYHTGALDGTSLLSQALDNFSQQGVVFVTSAGNNGDETFHIKYDFSADTMQTRVNFYTGAVNNLWGQSIHAWGEPGNVFNAKVKILNTSNQTIGETIWYSTTTASAYIDTFIVVGTDTLFYNLSADNSYPTNNCPQMRLRIKKPPVAFRVVLESWSSSGTVHYWNVTELTSDVGNWGMPFSSLGTGYTAGDAFYSIGAPACTGTAITVASHLAEYVAFNNNIFGGARSNFSSIGPLMTGAIKPDISAAGQSVASSISSYTDNNYSTLTTIDFNGRTYPFAKFSGTSMSSPAVAGIAALLLEANPDLSAMQVKQIIMQTARLDDETGPIGQGGDTYWGAGKANAYAAIKRAINTVGTLEYNMPLSWTVYPNPSNGIVTINGITPDVQAIQIINFNGQLVATFRPEVSINLEHLPAGMYIVRLLKNNRSEQRTIIIQ